MSSVVRRRLTGVLLLAALAAVTAAAGRLQIPVFVVGPGPVLPVSQLLEVSGGVPAAGGRQVPAAGDAAGSPDDPGAGHAGASLWLVTIEARQATLGEVVRAAFDPGRDVVAWNDLVPPGQDVAEFLETNRRLMEESQQVAVYAAYRFLGRPASLVAAGAELLSVRPGSPAERAGLRPGDVVIAVDGRPISFAGDLARAVAGAGGRDLRWTVDRGGRPVEATVAPGDAASLEQVGVTAVSRDLEGAFAPAVRFDPGDVAGPSAGLAFGLFLVESLAPGTVAAAGPVAATGILEVDGTVGAVGGVRYKARAVARAGARVFIVPAANAGEARAAAPELRVIGVTSLAEAVTALRHAPLTPFLSHPYNDAGLGAIPVAHRHR